MKIIGFNFDKINIEKLTSKTEKNLEVKTNIDILEIKEIKSESTIMKEDFLGVQFIFNINYDPDFAKINLSGNVLFAIDSKFSKDILKQWKDKKMPEDFRILLFNVILRKANLKALELEEEMNLPLHVPMPSLKKQEDKPKDK